MLIVTGQDPILIPQSAFKNENLSGILIIYTPMDRSLREHILHLEQRLQTLNRQIMENRRSQIERNRIESEIRAAQLALTYYRKALELEQQVGESGTVLDS